MKWWGWIIFFACVVIAAFLIKSAGEPASIIPLNDLPNVPGSVDSRVTQDNIQQTICVSGYTATVRPSSSYTTRIKMQMIAEQYPTHNASEFELDHLISLELGGCPNCTDNLWLEPWNGTYGARTKDKLENYLHKQVCENKMSLGEAQDCISQNWISCGRKLGVYA